VDPATLRHTLVGAAAGGGLFGAVAIYRSLVAGGDLLAFAGPAVARRSGGDPADAESEEGGGARQPPLWVHLPAGAAVGFGIGLAWGRLWAGVAVGLALAALARRIFRP